MVAVEAVERTVMFQVSGFRFDVWPVGLCRGADYGGMEVGVALKWEVDFPAKKSQDVWRLRVVKNGFLK
jgi:hypothetical protein